jgi:hypothetical protein
MPQINFEDGKVDRRFTREWSTSGIINIERLPNMVESLISDRKGMIAYIEELHNTLDYILKKNGCCDMPGCFTAGCGSDHK